ncbi:peroxisomal biogenesis factor 3 [Myxozyma melibiosi]|uniref:Peroxin-3 n=1 Tax=Myxozyma melibiosi TaxID=54550 RepID=A0ABR1EY88_9ASCO
MQFIHRHRRKIAAAVGVATAGYYAYTYLKTKLEDWQASLTSGVTNKENLRRRFEQNQNDASFTVAALLSSLTDPLMETMPVEEITRELQAKQRIASASASETGSVASSSVTAEEAAGGGKARSKKEMWEEIKIMSVTRAVSMMYATALLIFFTRLQLNLLGRKNYLDSVLSLSEEVAENEAEEEEEYKRQQKEVVDNEVNRRFLTYSWWLLNNGWQDLVAVVQRATIKAFEDVSPRSELTYSDFSSLLTQVRASVSSQTSPYLTLLLPRTRSEEHNVLDQNPDPDFYSTPALERLITPRLDSLLDEAKDLIESPNAAGVVAGLLDQAFGVLLSSLQVAYFYDEQQQQQQEKKVRLANLLAGVTRQSHEMTIANSQANQYLLAMNATTELKMFSAVVYSNYGTLGSLV